jgi:hypothetical protein
MWRRVQKGSGSLIPFLLSSLSGSFTVNADGADKLGAVSSESRICSEIGIGLLERGVRFTQRNVQAKRANHMTLGKCGRCARWDDSLCGSNRLAILRVLGRLAHSARYAT